MPKRHAFPGGAKIAFSLLGGIAAIGLAAFGVSILAKPSNSVEPADYFSKYPELTHLSISDESQIDSSRFIHPDAFESTWSSASSAREEGKPIAGIVNHHAAAPDLISDFFKRLSASRPDAKRLIILSPDHRMTGLPGTWAVDSAYATPGGRVEVDADAVQDLIATNVFKRDRGAIATDEHGIGVLMPFVRRAFGDRIRVLPLIISQRASDDAIKRLAEALDRLWDDQTVVILSADLSHGLAASAAEEHDQITIRSLERLDGQAMRLATDDDIDSGTNAAVLFALMRKRGIRPVFHVFSHRNSTEYGGPPDAVTTYLTGAWEM
jgi:AmmeMemoRadiSam system protein B